VSTLAACVGEILGVGSDALPLDEEGVRAWLASRGLGLVAVDEPDGFAWPGRFLGRDAAGSWAVLFGVPPGIIAGELRPPVAAAFVVAGHDPRAVAAPAAALATGTVEAIVLGAAASEPLRVVRSATAVAGRGLEGDRYHAGAGTFSGAGGPGRDLTLVEVEALEDVGLEPSAARRNVVVRGLELDALLGRRFRVGAVECLGQRRCEPCAHLQRLTRPGVLRALVHRGGLRADVVVGGELRVGDAVTAL
jgi:MOSC domain-containing protein YiiM